MQYIHVAKHNIPAVLRDISRRQTSNGTFYNVRVLPYRGKALDRNLYVTIAIG